MVNIATSKENVRHQRVSLGTLNGGLWLDMPPTDIPPNGWSDGYNWVVGTDYNLRPFLGRELLADLTDSTTTGAPFHAALPTDLTIYGVAEHRGTGHVFVFIGDQIAMTDGSGWEWITLPSGYTIDPDWWTFSMVGEPEAGVPLGQSFLVCTSPSNAMLFINKSNVVLKIDTTDFYGVHLCPAWSCTYKGRLWIGGDPTYADSIFGSFSGAPTEWFPGEEASTGDPQELKIGLWDGDPVRAGISKWGHLFIIKARSVWTLNAADPNPDNWQVDKFTAVGGTPNCRLTIQDIGPDVIYQSYSGNFCSLMDTEKSGLFDSTSITARQIRSWMNACNTDTGASIVDDANGWYLVALPATVDGQHVNYAIYDFAKRTPQTPGLWYRVAPISKTIDDVVVVANARSCFGRSVTLSATNADVVVSGDYNGRLYYEFQQYTEDLCDDSSGDIFSWIVGPHMVKDDYTCMHVLAISAIMKLEAVPTTQTLRLGAIMNPDTTGLTLTNPVGTEADFTGAAIFDVSTFDDCYFDTQLSVEAEAVVNGRGECVATYISATNAPVVVSRLFMSYEEGRV